ncbi:hypothetical protein EV681_4519 [Advenella incenata]|uniref:KfrB domain-containing protein n=1 Tax=Advenella incenata TaxID=267800 RepID=A0A4Q7V3X9_9BURK|nr:hypothetical protein [Advenella incenata]RZT91166.1 hypothetical protein EV681_4519 [Advenella incenata]
MSNEERKTIGDLLPKPDFETAREAVMREGQGYVHLPKRNSDYTGRILLMTDSHLIQQVGYRTAIAHDLSKLDKGKEIGDRFDRNEIKPKTTISIKYDNERGSTRLMNPEQARVERYSKDAEKWAEKNITNEQSRKLFLENIEKFKKDVSREKGHEKAQERPPAAREAEKQR